MMRAVSFEALKRWRASGAVVLALFLVACASGGTQTGAPPSTPSTAAPSGSTTGGSAAPGSTAGSAGAKATFPGADWEKVDAATAGLDQAKLDEIAGKAQAAGSSCFLVTRHGKLVGEWYWNNTTPTSTQEVFSATKSYTSVLVGIAQSEGKLDIKDKATKYIPEWANTPSQDITVQNLLSNNSGRHWDFQTDYIAMATREPNKTAFAIGLGQDGPPGDIWVYNNSAIQTLSAVLKKATGEEASDYAKQKLLGPIGMASSEIRKDASGGTLTFMGLSSTCRDMARFGWLLLNKGNWNGKQIVPASYVEDATGHSSQKLNAAYGYLFWLNRKGKLASPTAPTTGETGGDRPDGQMVPGAPEDMFWALGLGNQIISMDPGSDTVVVRIGPVNRPQGAPQFTQADTAKVVTEGVTKP